MAIFKQEALFYAMSFGRVVHLSYPEQKRVTYSKGSYPEGDKIDYISLPQNRIGGVMMSVVASSTIDRMFEP